MAPLRRSRPGSIAPIAHWLLYADHEVAPICRSLTIAPYIIERVLAAQEPIKLPKTANRSVLGTINDSAMHIRFLRQGNAASLLELHHRLNHMPMKPNGWKYAIESFKERIVDAVA